jgi:carbonic anhydrase
MLAKLPVLHPPATVGTDVERVLSDPRISPCITVSGHVYDVRAGLIKTVVRPASPTAAAADDAVRLPQPLAFRAD